MTTIKTFTYTKGNGKTSERAVIVLNEAAQHHFTIDISELDEEHQAIFAAKYAELRAKYAEGLSALMQEFDVMSNYRLFDPNKMSNIVDEPIN